MAAWASAPRRPRWCSSRERRSTGLDDNDVDRVLTESLTKASQLAALPPLGARVHFRPPPAYRPLPAASTQFRARR